MTNGGQVIDFSKLVRGLDFGCGIGRQTILMQEFGVEAYGIDISGNAIEMAKKMAKYFGHKNMMDRLSVVDGKHIPFADNFFDITICEAVLDSMKFELAKDVMKEIDRVTNQLVFISLISGDNHKHYRDFNGEETVEAEHEKGTVQSYYNYEKIRKLIDGLDLKIIWVRLVTEESLVERHKYGRYYIVLQKK